MLRILVRLNNALYLPLRPVGRNKPVRATARASVFGKNHLG